MITNRRIWVAASAGAAMLAGLLVAGVTAPAAAHAGVASRQWALTADGLTPAAEFGRSVAISGDTVVVGAPFQTVGSHAEQGAVYVYQRPSTGWASSPPVAVLTAPDGQAKDAFGYSVAISGDTIVASAYGASVGGKAAAGVTFVYVRPVGGWQTTAQPDAALWGSDGAAYDECGQSLAIDGPTVVVGCSPHSRDSGSYFEGAAYVFVRPATGWKSETQTTELEPKGLGDFDEFGQAVSISGPVIAVGAPGWFGSNDYGQAYGYVEPAGGWAADPALTETFDLSGSQAKDADFGGSLQVSGATIVVGESSSSTGAANPAGAAYVFEQPTNGWVANSAPAYAAKLTTAGLSNERYLGSAVSISGGVVTAGAPDAPNGSGLAAVFAEPAGGWASETQLGALSAPSPAVYDDYAGALAQSGSTLVVGASGNQADMTGSAYVVAAPGPSITGVKQSRRKWTAGTHLLKVNPRKFPSGGTRLHFSLSQPGTVSLAFSRIRSGRAHLVETVTFAATALNNVVYFDSRLPKHKRLQAGKAKLAIVVGNANGVSTVHVLRFTVKPAPKRTRH